ncbi:hypothetical protein K461DRAFT_292073 [Myriangium duriaei CBS 260.36]|uniref:Uncharacterized protein n=1 Tax=Myriangium duriaei CBS 260.36 TaxID=1168546 RepID=A0A9P4MHT8_9PEZI|nr:hypothetical protein K461DRAFT_292073 [Myriangium duriaei CBS 260.36]
MGSKTNVVATATSQNEHPFCEQPIQINGLSCNELAACHGIPNTAAGWDKCFEQDLEAKILDSLYPYLQYVARKDSAHIDPLHKQLVKDRTIVVSENPKLHLVWHYSIIYIKPIPSYLFNGDIWTERLPPPPTQSPDTRPRYDKYRAALGFLRSYGLLIRHESDLLAAQRADLLPKTISFKQFQAFIQPFRTLPDDAVSHRYHYGQIRLTRLNWTVRILHLIQILYPAYTGPKVPWHYQEHFWQTSQYIEAFATPLIFVFAALTLILSSMQVGLAAIGTTTDNAFVHASWGFALVTIVFAASPIVGTLIGCLVVLVCQWQFAVRMKWREKRRIRDVEQAEKG